MDLVVGNLCHEGKDGGTGDGEEGDTHLGSSTIVLSWWGTWDDWGGAVAWGRWDTGSSGDWGNWGGWLLGLGLWSGDWGGAVVVDWSLDWLLGLWGLDLWGLGLWGLGLWGLDLWGLTRNWSSWGWGHSCSGGGWNWGGNNWDVGGGRGSWARWLLWWAGSDGHDLGLVDDNVWVGNGIDTEDNGGDSGDGRETHFDVCSCFSGRKKLKRFLKLKRAVKSDCCKARVLKRVTGLKSLEVETG